MNTSPKERIKVHSLLRKTLKQLEKARNAFQQAIFLEQINEFCTILNLEIPTITFVDGAQETETNPKIVWLYDGPGAVKVKATPYRRMHYPWFLENPDADIIMVSPSMLFDKVLSAPDINQAEYTSTANRAFTSSEAENCNSDSTNAQALSKTPEAPIVSKSTETPRQEITKDAMN